MNKIKKVKIIGILIAVLVIAGAVILFAEYDADVSDVNQETNQDYIDNGDVVEEESEEEEGEEEVSNIKEFDSGVRGQVLLGPQCPVVREGEECPDKGYATKINIYRGGGLYLSTESNKDGFYEASLPPGEYRLEPVGEEPFPNCEGGSETVTVLPNEFTQSTLRCDTGIR